MDLIIRNALMVDEKSIVDLGIKDGKFAEIAPRLEVKGGVEIDAKKKLVTPTFIDPHIHLDKILIAEVVRDNVSGTLSEAIEIIWEKKKNYTKEV